MITMDEGAVLPTRAHPDDIGLDLTVTHLVKNLTPNTYLCGTGIHVEPEKGFYVEIYGRSSISKSGYMVANGTGIIDPSYTGQLMVALKDLDGNGCPEFPFRCAQLVTRKAFYGEVVVTSKKRKTVRGEGGYGSTG